MHKKEKKTTTSENSRKQEIYRFHSGFRKKKIFRKLGTHTVSTVYCAITLERRFHRNDPTPRSVARCRATTRPTEHCLNKTNNKNNWMSIFWQSFPDSPPPPRIAWHQDGHFLSSAQVSQPISRPETFHVAANIFSRPGIVCRRVGDGGGLSPFAARGANLRKKNKQKKIFTFPDLGKLRKRPTFPEYPRNGQKKNSIPGEPGGWIPMHPVKSS